MLKIKTPEIEFTLTVDSTEENSADFPYYSICFKLSTLFISKEIRYSAIWEAYNSEIETFKSELIRLKDKDDNGEVTLSLMNENSTLTIVKITSPYEVYVFRYRLSSSANSELFIQGESILDQTYISAIVMGVDDLLK